MKSEGNSSISSSELEDSSLSELLYEKLKDCCYLEAVEILKGKKWKNYLKDNSLEIVPVISRILNEDFCTVDTENCIEEMLEYIASIANYKEAMLVFLEEIEIFRSTTQFKIMLKPLQIILLKNVSKTSKSSSFSWVFNTLNAHLSVMPLPSYENLEGNERKLLDSDPQQQNIVETLTYVYDFYSVFYKSIISGELVWPEKDIKSQEYFSYFLLNFFHKPLAFLDVYNIENNPTGTLYILCSKFVNMITVLVANPIKLLVLVKIGALKEESRSKLHAIELEDEEKRDLVSQLSLGMYFYCLIGQNMCIGNIPYVYASEYLFISCLPLCLQLIEEKAIFTVHKGLILFQGLLDKLNKNSLTQSCLEVQSHIEILHKLVEVMIYYENKECRLLALHSFKDWIWKFNSGGRYQLFISIFSSVTHTGVLGVVIHEVKENLRMVISNNCKSIDKNFCSNKLYKILNLACNLPNGERTDILEASDKIMGALNLIIFLCLFDKSNLTDYKHIMPNILKNFLNPLENGLRISKGHFELKLKELNENKNNSSELVINVNIISTPLPGIPKEKEKEIILQALNWFDIIQCVWARARKLINEVI